MRFSQFSLVATRVARAALVLTIVCVLALSGSPAGATTVVFTGDPASDFAAAGTVTSDVTLNPDADPSGTYSGNFATPSNLTDYNPYTIYTNSDANNYYVGVEGDGPVLVGNLDFTNLYFSTNLPEGSTVGFEANNSLAFVPGVPGSYPYTGASGITLLDSSTPTSYAIEFSVPWSFFTSDPLGMGFTKAVTDVELRLSQTFGYSVAGGASYGVTSPFDADTTTRFGDFAIPTPEPSTIVLAGLGAIGCWMIGLRGKRRPAAAGV